MKSLVTAFILSLILSSCGGMVNRMHKDFDRYENNSKPKSRVDKFDMYRTNGARRAPYRNGNRVSTSNKKYVSPSVKRRYSPGQFKKRFKAEDLNDTKNTESLWAGSTGKDNFLFTQDKKKKNGDIVLVQVQGRLKNEITAELNRSFPLPKKKKKKKEEAKPGAPATAAAPPPKPAEKDEKEVNEDDSKVYDKISSVVVEEINQDHILVRGRKNLLFRKSKRQVEVQALVNRRDVGDDDTIMSDRIIESNVTVMR